MPPKFIHAGGGRRVYQVMSEENAETSLLQTKIHMQDIYQRQQDTIISWNEPDTGVDYALSFQNPDGCTELWEQICGLQGRSMTSARDGDGGGGSGSLLGGGGGAVSRDDALTLPAPEMRNLAAIADALTDVPIFRRGKLVEALLRGDYLPALVRLFATVEDLESRPDLHHLYNIFKGVIAQRRRHLRGTAARRAGMAGFMRSSTTPSSPITLTTASSSATTGAPPRARDTDRPAAPPSTPPTPALHPATTPHLTAPPAAA